jgi:hypothetical protein
MRLLVISKVDIKGKDQREWVKFYGLSAKAEIVESFMPKAQYETLGFPADSFLSVSDIEAMFKEYKSVNVSFDSRGRVESASE